MPTSKMFAGMRRSSLRTRDLAIVAAANGSPLPAAYQRYYRWWFALGWPAFIGLLVIFYLMVAEP
jgi:uncharacterized membrane protein